MSRRLFKTKERALDSRGRIDWRLVVLRTVQTGLFLSALVAPNALGAMIKLGIIPNPRQRREINLVQQKLLRGGFIAYKNGYARLTEKGVTELRWLAVSQQMKRKPRRWNKKWHMLIFDIPESRRGTRREIRKTLKSTGFLRLQDSVWVYPYDCEDFVTLFKADIKVGKDLLYLVVDAGAWDRPCRVHFGL